MITAELVLAVDPGKTTGIALLHRRDDELILLYSGEHDEDNVALVVRKLIEHSRTLDVWLTIVIERFTITPQTAKNSQAPYSLEVIGVVKQCCRDAGIAVNDIVMQSPSNAKSAVDNTKIRALDLWHKGGAGHALDAIRHGVSYFIGRGWVSKKLLA